MKPLSKNIIIFLIIVIGIGIALSSYNVKDGKPEIIGTSSFVEKIEAGEVDRIEVREDTVLIFANDEAKSEFTVKKENDQSLTDLLTSYGIATEQLTALNIEIKEPNAGVTLLKSVLPTLIFLIGFFIIFWFILKQMQGANNRAMTFGQSRAKQNVPQKNKVQFKDVAGSIEAKEELKEIVDFLQHPKKYTEIGAKIPKGMLLMGPPGTGKTLLARAVAGEANVPFFHISGSEFVEMFVGVGASRVRDLFQKAKKASPCIIFIDEIDAVGRQRGAGLGGGNDEREQTLNQILVEMDGFEANAGVIVIAATNRPDVLDPALLRPGRFDRRITLDFPSLKDREQILEVHAKNKPLAEDINLKRVAERTIGKSGADLMNVMNEGAILAARENKKKIHQEHLLEAIEKVLMGPSRKSNKHEEKDDLLVTAYHEAGHALVGHLLPHCDDIHKVTVIPRGRAGGYTLTIPEKDQKYTFRSKFIDDMAMFLGGYAAEKEIFGDVSTGPASDLDTVTRTAKRLVTRHGMSKKLGTRTYGEHEENPFLGRSVNRGKDYSDKTAEEIDEEVLNLVNQALETATRIIHEHRSKLEKVVKVLLERETIEKEEFEEILGKPNRPAKLEIKAA
jgi:cell division protease FtsH